MASKRSGINVSEVLPDDNEIVSRSLQWRKLFEKYGAADKNDDDQGLPIDEAFEMYRSTGNDDEDDSSASDVGEDGDVDSDSSYDSSCLADAQKQLAVVVKERSDQWKVNGMDEIINDVQFLLSTTFVENWLSENVPGSSKRFEREQETRVTDRNGDSMLDLTCKNNISVMNDAHNKCLASTNSSKYEMTRNNRTVVVQQVQKTTMTTIATVIADGSHAQSSFNALPYLNLNPFPSFADFHGFKLPDSFGLLKQLTFNEQKPIASRNTRALKNADHLGETGRARSHNKKVSNSSAQENTLKWDKPPVKQPASTATHKSTDKAFPGSTVNKKEQSARANYELQSSDEEVGRSFQATHQKKSCKTSSNSSAQENTLKWDKPPVKQPASTATHKSTDKAFPGSSVNKTKQSERANYYGLQSSDEEVGRSFQATHQKKSCKTSSKNAPAKPRPLLPSSNQRQLGIPKEVDKPKIRSTKSHQSMRTKKEETKTNYATAKSRAEGEHLPHHEVGKTVRKNAKDKRFIIVISSSDDESGDQIVDNDGKPATMHRASDGRPTLKGSADVSVKKEPQHSPNNCAGSSRTKAPEMAGPEPLSSTPAQYTLPLEYQKMLSEQDGRCLYNIQGIVVYRPKPNAPCLPRDAEKIHVDKHNLDLSAIASAARRQKFDNFKQRIHPNSTLVYYMSESEDDDSKRPTTDQSDEEDDDDPIGSFRPNLVVYEFKNH